MLVALIILALYFWAYFSEEVTSIGASLLVSDAAATLAGLALIIGFVSYLWAPKKYIQWGSFTAYALLTITTATLILNTGATSSPFIALWMVVSVFAGVFGALGILPIFLALAAYLTLQFSAGTLTRETILTVVLAGELPLGISYLMWHAKTKADANKSDERSAYNELATELSQVSGKSDAVINAIGDGVIALNGQGVIQLINPAAQQIIGWGRQDALSLDYKSVLKLIDKNENELTTANDPVSQTLATNKEIRVNDLKLITNSGKKLFVSVVVSPAGQTGSGVIIVFRDITKEKSEEREQAEFISTASHEMRTPVASIEGYLGLALNPNTAQIDDKARDFIGKAQASAQHLGRLFQDLLDVTKAEDGRLASNPKVIDLVAFAHDIVEGLRPKANEKGLRMLFKPMPDNEDDAKGSERRLNPVFYVNVDNDQLREVIANLVENAIKYTPNGDVVIDITGDADNATISVADSGIGIPKEDIPHLFQKFYRVDNTDTREIGGTGLGLYLCRRLTETMGGRIWVESEFKKGSTFYVELPRISHEEATRLIEATSIQEEQQARIEKISKPEALPALSEPGTTVPDEISPLSTMPAQSSSTAVISAPAAPAQTPTTPGEATYTSPPVETVVEQLRSIGATGQPRATVTAPQYVPSQPAATAPVVPAPPPQAAPQAQAQPPAYTPSAQLQPSQAPRTNVPLSVIEQNPGQFTRGRQSSVPIPPRDQQ